MSKQGRLRPANSKAVCNLTPNLLANIEELKTKGKRKMPDRQTNGLHGLLIGNLSQKKSNVNLQGNLRQSRFPIIFLTNRRTF